MLYRLVYMYIFSLGYLIAEHSLHKSIRKKAREKNIVKMDANIWASWRGYQRSMYALNF